MDEEKKAESIKEEATIKAESVDLPLVNMTPDDTLQSQTANQKTESDLAISRLFSQENPESKDSAKTTERNKQKNNKRNTTLITAGIAGAMILVLAFTAFFFFRNTNLTGFVVAGPTEQTYAYNQEFATTTETTLGFQNIKGLKITGTLDGTGALVKLKTPTREYVVANITGTAGQEYTLTTDKRNYNLGETVVISLNPIIETKTIYIQKGDENNILSEGNFTPNETGEYRILAIITTENDIIRLQVNITVTNVSIEAGEPEVSKGRENANVKTFTTVCVDSCLLQEETSSPILSIELDGSSKLKITDITTLETKTDQTPIQTKTFPDMTLKTGEAISIQLQDYFSDPDGNRLQFEMNQIPELSVSITQDTLSITGNTQGEYIAHIYASDANNMITGNDFKITVSDTAITQITNQTSNNTVNTTEPPINTTNTTQTQEATAQPTDCNNPNPNLRPLYCIEGSEEQYFTPKQIILENADRLAVGRFTTFGNLVIRGKLVESSTGRPNGNDFRISYIGGDGETELSNAWIDSETGDLHLKGRIYEEQISLVPPGTDVFVIQNKKGTTLAYFDKYTGNLYLRGNLVSEKPDLE